MQATPTVLAVFPAESGIGNNGVRHFAHLPPLSPGAACHYGRGNRMAAMKPRTGDGPMEVTKEGRGIVMRVPLEGGGRLVVELNADEAGELGTLLQGIG